MKDIIIIIDKIDNNILFNIVINIIMNQIIRLPNELQRYIYTFIHDDVKVYYWLDKYNWSELLSEIFNYYCETYIVEKYYKLCPQKETELLYEHFQYVIDKYFNDTGHRVKLHWWEFVGNNDNNNLLAVAKLSQPLKKDFTTEALIRVKLDY